MTKWFNWMTKQEKPDYFYGLDEKERLLELSKEKDFEILETLGLNYSEEKYKKYIGTNNAQDFVFQNFYQTPQRYSINKILDFGAGYGRQLNLYSQENKNLVYVSMDAIEKSYCLQNLYYKQFKLPFFDYIKSRNKFMIKDEPGIYHLPTWRKDLLPDNFFDLIICCQVLQELNPKLFKEMLKTFNRVLCPGGALYIRDSNKPMGAHDLNTTDYLEKQGFILEFRPYVSDNVDVHGIPRIWRKKDSIVEKSKKSKNINLKRIIKSVDLMSKNKISKMYHHLKNFKNNQNNKKKSTDT